MKPAPRQSQAGSLRLFDDAPVIASVTPDPADPNLRRVRVGRRTVAVIAAVDAEALGVREGAAWDEALSAAVARRATALAARRDALKALAAASIGSRRLRERLERRGYEPALAAEVVASLVRDGWLDDAAVAGAAAASVQRRGRLPRRAVAERLVDRGIDPTLAERAARDGAAPGDDELQACTAMAARLLRPGKAGAGPDRSDWCRQAQRVAAALARRGFDPDIIARALDSLGARCGERDRRLPEE